MALTGCKQLSGQTTLGRGQNTHLQIALANHLTAPCPISYVTEQEPAVPLCSHRLGPVLEEPDNYIAPPSRMGRPPPASYGQPPIPQDHVLHSGALVCIETIHTMQRPPISLILHVEDLLIVVCRFLSSNPTSPAQSYPQHSSSHSRRHHDGSWSPTKTNLPEIIHASLRQHS
ncbi:hypothetical protein FRC16_000622 [Serendipita sp. 398]|nr:hypothetical protein FRC16_000622 [Serendipita sp. 398]